mmetsp:Transcript_10321/g.10301  ORF Transcript_10321/g.10301 Transcript_10321/m.10301 type:complete len:139 (-) Transcript_10321:1680-2096(-)
MISDEHATYVVLCSSKSRLAAFGYYHYWIIHSQRYSHEKFTFVHTSNIELQWARLKRTNNELKRAHTEERIQKFADSYCLRQVLKKECLYYFVLKCMRKYYFDTLLQYKQYTQFQEMLYPGFDKIDHIIDMLRSQGPF